jgi:hypothetical protein
MPLRRGRTRIRFAHRCLPPSPKPRNVVAAGRETRASATPCSSSPSGCGPRPSSGPAGCLDAAERFYVDVLGLRASDTIEMGIAVQYLHCTGQAARHHSLAMSAVAGMVGLHHLMLEVASIDDVGYSSRVAVQERSVRWWVSDRHG